MFRIFFSSLKQIQSHINKYIRTNIHIKIIPYSETYKRIYVCPHMSRFMCFYTSACIWGINFKQVFRSNKEENFQKLIVNIHWLIQSSFILNKITIKIFPAMTVLFINIFRYFTSAGCNFRDILTATTVEWWNTVIDSIIFYLFLLVSVLEPLQTGPAIQTDFLKIQVILKCVTALFTEKARFWSRTTCQV